MSTVPAASRPRLVRTLLGGLVLAVVYFLVARLGLTLASIHGTVSPVWPATGVAIGGLLLGGRHLWPALLLGAFAANLPGSIPVWGAAVIALGNTGEALAGAWIIARLRDGRRTQPLLWEAAGCGAAAVLAPILSAGLGVSVIAAIGGARDGDGLTLFWTWWLGDAIGALSLVPPILAAQRYRTWRAWVAPGWLGALAVAAAAAGVVFFMPWGGALLFGVFPVLLLAAYFGGELGVKGASIVVAAIGISAGFLGHGPFVGGSLNDNLLFLQLFLGSVAVAALILPVFAASGSLVMAGAFLAVGWSISGWLFARIHHDRLANDAAKFETLAADAERTTRQRMAIYLEALRAGAGLYAASYDVTSEDWRHFVQALGVRDRLPGLQALGVIWRVEHSALDDWVARRRAMGEPDYDVRIMPEGAPVIDDVHYLVHYAEPIETNRIRLGLDAASETRRRQAAEEARDTGEPRSSGRVLVFIAQGRQPGFLVFHPVYRRDAPLTSIEERRAAIQGWIFAAFVADDFFGHIFVSPEIEMSVFDGRSIADDARLYEPDSRGATRRGFEKVAMIELAGNLVTLAWRRSDRFTIASPVASVLAATSLALVTLLLAGLGVSLQSIGRQAREIAAARTAELTAAQSTLAGINRLHRAVLDGTNYSIIATETDGTIRIFNRGAERMLGYRREELIGRQTPASIHVPEEVVARATELSAELGRRIEPGFEVFVARAALGEVEEREWTYVRRNGSRLPVLLSVSALRDDAGAITGYLGIAHDLTERRTLEQSLRLEQSRLRLANDAAGIAVWEWDVETGALTWDAAMFALYGMAPTVGGRVTYDDWRHCVHPDDLLGEEAELQRVVREGGRGQREFRIIRHSDDEVRHVSASDLAIAGPDGRTVRVVGVNRDVTDQRRAVEQLRQSRARLASIFGAVREGLMLIDAEGCILECNAAICRILGLPREQLEGQPATDGSWHAILQDGSMCPPQDLPAAVTLRTGEAVRDAILGLPRADGSLLWISIDTAPIRDSVGAVQAVVVSVNDVSAQRQIARDLARARDEAVETSRLKSEFLATMSHEIRTPMNGIISTVDLLLGTRLDAAQHEMAHLIQGSAENLLEIINDILDFSRIEAGKFRVNPEPFEVLPLLEETAALLGVRAQRKGLELVLDADPALVSEVLVGDADRIRQVLLNIIGNAVKFTERGEIVVAAAVAPREGGTGRLRVSVRDTGIGIAAEFRDRLFHAFTQVDSSATRRHGGTGLGLAISRQLVELMGGQLDFSSEPGRGSEFWIELDLPRQAPAERGGSAADLDVLVVDDNAIARDTLVRQLARLGARAAGAAGAAAALDHVARWTPAPGCHPVVLVDRAMPGTDGLAFARRLRAVEGGAGLALIVLTPPGAAAPARELADLRCAAVIAKPVRVGQLLAALERARRGACLEAPPAEAAGARSAAAGADGTTLSVLVAEDNPTNQLVARMVLESMGHRVDVADNGRIALERLAEARYDLVLMDCQMPDLDGYEATRRIRAGQVPGVDPAQRIIALTAFAMEADRAKCAQAGMDDYLSKPVRMADVRALLERCGLAAPATGSGAADASTATTAALALPADIEAEPMIDEPFLDGLRGLPGLHGPSLLTEVVALYLKETAARLEELPGLVDAGSLDVVARIAHTLAGSSANAGAPRSRAAFRAIEWAVRDGALAEIPARIASARAVWQELRAEFVRRGLYSP